MPDAPTTPEVVAPEPVIEPAPEPPTAVTPAEPDWLPARLDRAKRSATSEALKELGVDSLEAAKAALEEAKTLKAAQMTEAEKLVEERDKALAARDEAVAAVKARDLTDLRKRIASETGLPEVLAAKLEGDDEAAMKAEAKAIIEALPSASQGLPPAAGDVKPPNTPEDDPIRRAFLGIK